MMIGKLFNRSSLFATATVLLTGCLTTYPLGMSEEEWLRLTPDQQYEARQEQAQRDHEYRQRRIEVGLDQAEADLAAAQRELAASKEERRRLEDELRREQDYNRRNRRGIRPLECIIYDGTYDFYPGWRHYDPIRFEIQPAETRDLTVHKKSSHMTGPMWVWFEPNGERLTFCEREPYSMDNDGLKRCTEIRGSYREFEDGINRSFYIRDRMRDATISCAFSLYDARNTTPHNSTNIHIYQD